MLDSLTTQLKKSRDLSPDQITEAIELLVSGDIAPAPKADFLTALAQKGETIEEIGTFAKILRDKSVQPSLSPACRQREILDVCGTGGDQQNTFNISTTVAIVAAAAGVTVAKHGNRAITSKSGSADVLEALGIRIHLTPEECAASLEQNGFVFFFAPNYHPAFKHISSARKLCAEQGQRTIFNFLGPLLNPARPTTQLIGVPDPALCKPIAKVLQSIGIRRGMVVSGDVGTGNLDELSTLGTNTIAEFYQDRAFSVEELDPQSLPVQPAQIEDLKGGDSKANAQTIREILNGTDKGPKRDAVLLNAGAALFVAEKSPSLTEGWDLAARLINDGAAMDKLTSLSNC
ncbi:MAG: Anthranilate phosphoribosyltransferase 2 [Verrucomicrobia subdivision 3 bacterium]|nr:Anthranilate phosphoribosyltransferase 2 [Limisphaerales bacterium]MCS1412874.1 Anthranilate phosphoribosyltransferase 2 [Limisphaerales bacterium]